MIFAGNQQDLKNLNRMALVREIRARPGVSRVDLARRLGLNKSTVGKLVEELIAEGWLTESSKVMRSGVGRYPTPLVLDCTRRLIIGAGFNESACEAIAASLDGQVRELTFGFASGAPEWVMDFLAGQIEALYRRLVDGGYMVAGIGVAAPGPVLPGAGVLHHSDAMGWRNVPVRQLLEDRLNARGMPTLPLIVERATNCVALNHFESERVADAEPLVYVQVGRGISSAAISRGRIIHGHNGLAGYCSHLVVEPGGPLCACGQRGCANVVLTSRAMEMALGMDSAAIRERAAEGDERVLAVMRSTGEKLGDLLFNFCVQYDPARLALGGPAFQLGGTFLGAAQERLSARAAQTGLITPPLQVMRFDDRTKSVGAAMMMWQNLLLRAGGQESK